MPHPAPHLDGLILAVADADAAAALFTRLGFAVTARQGYGEILFAAGRLLLVPAADGRTRLAAVDLAAADPALVAASLAAAGVGPGPARPGPDGAPRFELPAAAAPGLNARLAARRAAAMVPAHDNGVSGLASLTLLLERPEEAMPAYDRLFGAFAATPTDDMVTVHGGGPLLFLVDEDGFDHLHANLAIRLPPAPALAAAAFAVPDLEALAARLTAAGFTPRRAGPTLSLPPEQMLGLGLEFVQG
ncbi:glyoxalase-like domain protein [mine drainage metagenome]|uniref:Glyoxalase-like domain protein n=1 Tax=mine drainage metagenome TaxID=410659 RepID=A0A1J5RW90_9ZZZZ